MERYSFLCHNGDYGILNREELNTLIEKDGEFQNFKIPNIGDIPEAFICGHGKQYRIKIFVTRIS